MWWKWWTSDKSLEAERALADKLVSEIWEAHSVWLLAHNRFNQAQGADEIDYAVYMLEAAEKRYEMLIRRAKLSNVEQGLWR
jgi:hypothetical protein